VLAVSATGSFEPLSVTIAAPPDRTVVPSGQVAVTGPVPSHRLPPPHAVTTIAKPTGRWPEHVSHDLLQIERRCLRRRRARASSGSAQLAGRSEPVLERPVEGPFPRCEARR
jgi:hypothetical protein